MQRDTLAAYMNNVCAHKVLSRQEEYSLAVKAKQGDSLAREKVIVSNLRFVVQTANKFKTYTKSGRISLLDLIQEGNHGLVHAFSKYDPESGYRFTTYAVHWIRAKIMSYVIKTSSIVKIGTTAIERTAFFKSGKIKQLIEERDNDKKASSRIDLAKQLKVTESTIQKIEDRFHWNDVSTEKTMAANNVDGTSTMTLGDMLTTPSVEEEIELNLFRAKIQEALEASMEGLNEREKNIMTERWLSTRPATLQAIGNKEKLSRERIRQIEMQVFSKIKRYLVNDDLGREIIKHYQG